MAAIDDLKAAITRVNTDVTAEIKAVSDKIAALAAAPTSGGVTEADAQDLVAQLNGIATTLETETATLTAPPTPPVAG